MLKREKLTNLGGEKTIKAFVAGKLKKLSEAEQSFDALFPIMFSEKGNVFYEESDAYSITRMTYGAAYEEVIRKSGLLKERLSKIRDHGTVGLYMENSAAWIINFWAILRAGYCPLLMNLRLDKETLEDALKTLDAVAVISDGEEFSVETIFEDEFEDIGHRQQSAETGRFGDTFFVMSSGTSEHVKLCAYQAEQVFSILENSREIVSESRSMQRHYHGELKQLTFLPFYHIFGFVAVYLWFAFYSRTFVGLKDLAPETLLSTVRRHGVTHIFAVPLFWEKIHQAAEKAIKGRGEETYQKFLKGMKIADSLDGFAPLSRWFSDKAFYEIRKNLFGEGISFLISGGGQLSQETIRFFNHIGYTLSEGYGMTEIGISGVELSESPKQRNTSSVGEPLASYEYEIRDGELFVKSRSMAAYTIRDGVKETPGEWFATGDIAAEMKYGYRILGRKDDLIVTESGENLNPNLIEPKLLIGGVKEVALLPVRENGRILPTLLVSVSKFLSDEGKESMEKRLCERLTELKLSGAVRRILFTAEPLIQGTEFKVNRKKITRQLESGETSLLNTKKPSSTGTGATENDPVRQTITALFAEALNKTPEEVGYSTDFFMDEGGSSLDFLLLTGKLQNTFEVTIPRDFGTEAHSIETVERFITHEINGVDTLR